MLTRRMAVLWWPLFPLFCCVVPWSAHERLAVGGSAGHALDALRMSPGVTWMAAAIYLLGWVWVLASCIRSVAATGQLFSNLHRLATAAQPLAVKTLLLIAAIAADQLPATAWRWILHIGH